MYIVETSPFFRRQDPNFSETINEMKTLTCEIFGFESSKGLIPSLVNSSIY